MFAWLRSVFSEDGQGSFSRTASGAVVITALGWVTYVVVRTHAIPDLSGVTTFITAIVGVLYGLNKAPDIISAVTQKPTDPTKP